MANISASGKLSHLRADGKPPKAFTITKVAVVLEVGAD